MHLNQFAGARRGRIKLATTVRAGFNGRGLLLAECPSSGPPEIAPPQLPLRPLELRWFEDAMPRGHFARSRSRTCLGLTVLERSMLPRPIFGLGKSAVAMLMSDGSRCQGAAMPPGNWSCKRRSSASSQVLARLGLRARIDSAIAAASRRWSCRCGCRSASRAGTALSAHREERNLPFPSWRTQPARPSRPQAIDASLGRAIPAGLACGRT